MKPLAFCTCILIFLIHCAPQMYYYGKYSHTLYNYKKNPNDKTFQDHMSELDDIIEKSNEKNLRVPPGIYCEYAYLLLQKGEKKEALKYIDLEEHTYPESVVFIERLRKLVTGQVPDTLAKEEEK